MGPLARGLDHATCENTTSEESVDLIGSLLAPWKVTDCKGRVPSVYDHTTPTTGGQDNTMRKQEARMRK